LNDIGFSSVVRNRIYGSARMTATAATSAACLLQRPGGQGRPVISAVMLSINATLILVPGIVSMFSSFEKARESRLSGAFAGSNIGDPRLQY